MKAILLAASLSFMADKPAPMNTIHFETAICRKCEDFKFNPIAVQFPNVNDVFKDPLENNTIVHAFLDRYQQGSVRLVEALDTLDPTQHDEYMFYQNTHTMWSSLIDTYFNEHEIKKSFVQNSYLTMSISHNGTVTFVTS